MFLRRIFLGATLLTALSLSHTNAQCNSNRIQQLYDSCKSTLATALSTIDCTSENSILSATEKVLSCFDECGDSNEAKSAFERLGFHATLLIQQKCKFTGGRQNCDIVKVQSCPGVLAPFTNLDAYSSSITSLQTFCTQYSGLSANIADCSQAVVSCSAVISSLREIFDTVTNSINVANEINTKACDCSRNIKSSVDNFANAGRVCSVLQTASTTVSTTTNTCVQQFYGSMKPFRFDVMANQYLALFLTVIPLGCNVPFNFIASSACRLGSPTAMALSIIVLLYILRKN